MSFEKQLPVYPLPVFVVPRFGRVEFEPIGDVPLRQTKAWCVTVIHTSPGRIGTPDYRTWHGDQSSAEAAPYPTAKTARTFMLRACAHHDLLPLDHYSEQKIVPPLRSFPPLLRPSQ
jgi:hypothetical protein